MKRSTGPFLGDAGTRALVLAAIISASAALSVTAATWSIKPSDPSGLPDPVCPIGFNLTDGECVLVTPPTTCPDGYHLEGESCSPDVIPTCPEGFIYSEGQCVLEESPDPNPNLTNNPPNAVNDSTTATKGIAVTTNVLSNDSDPDGDALAITSVTDPAKGSATKNSDGTITYTPDTGYVGTDSYQYTISDGTATDTATVTVSVPPSPPSVIPFSELHGVNFIDRNLDRNEGGRKRPIQTDYVDEFVAKAKESDFNVFRIPVRWEGYADNKAIFLEELDYLVNTANKHDIHVWIVFFQYDATSHWPYKVSPFGGGFPKFVVSCYHPTKDYERDPEIRAFWDDYYLNKVRDSSNSCRRTLDVWTLQAGFMEDMINQVDKYPNVIGYELINEPHVWKDSHYDQLGELHTSLAKELRKSTDKVLIFTRETAHGFNADGKKYERKAGLEYKILPKDPAKNVMYAPHIYSPKDIEKQVSQWKGVQKKWAAMGYDVEIAVGEFAPQSPQIKSPSATLQDIDRFVSVWSREGWMHTYWSYGGFVHGEWNVLVKYNGDLASVGEYLAKTIIKYYDDQAS